MLVKNEIHNENHRLFFQIFSENFLSGLYIYTNKNLFLHMVSKNDYKYVCVHKCYDGENCHLDSIGRHDGERK